MAYFSDIFGPDEKLEQGKIYPTAIVVPADMSEEQFEQGLKRALINWYDFERSPLPNSHIMHVGFVKMNPPVIGEAPLSTWDVTPRIIERSLGFKPGAVVAKVDRNYLTGVEAYSKGFVPSQVFQQLWDYLIGTTEEPVRWLEQDAVAGPNETHIVWVLWQGKLPSKDDVEKALSEYDITNLWGRFEKIPIYTEKGSTIIEIWLAFGNQGVRVYDLEQILGAQEIRVATVPKFEGTGTSAQIAISSAAEIVYNIVASTGNATMAAADAMNAVASLSRDLTRDKDAIKTYLKIAGAIGLGAVGVWAASQVVSWFRTGQRPQLPWKGRGVRRSARSAGKSSSSSTAIVRA